MRRQWITLLLAMALPALACAAAPAPVTVYAAASLSESLQALTDRFSADTGVPVRLSFAASSSLARQIEAGAPADLFISADEEWMDYLAERRLIDSKSRRVLLGNRLVLIAAAGDPVTLTIGPNFALSPALGSAPLAVADPDSVPAGRYAQAALRHFGVWESVRSHLARAENVRGALQYVARGEARLGVVYATDAKADARVRVVDVFPASSHPPIHYPAAVLNSSSADAQRLLTYLASASAATVWTKYGFLVQ
jgi:molybdate transport system substrate-binding protein